MIVDAENPEPGLAPWSIQVTIDDRREALVYLPEAGRYRAQVFFGREVLDSRPFEVADTADVITITLTSAD
jgi:hypothetical protein